MIATRVIPPLLVAAVIAFACGPRTHSSEAPERSRTVSGPAIVTALDVRQRASDIQFVFRIANNANKKLELMFPNGQTHDLVVLDAAGEEVWRWSEGRMFTQVLQNRIVGGGDTLTVEVTWTPPAGLAGMPLTAVASLLSDSHPLEERAEFVVSP